MAEQLDPSEIVDLRELLMSEVIQSDALINLLELKGILTKKELLEEMKRVKSTLPKSESGGKKLTSKITREVALEIAGRETGVLSCTGITDRWSPAWAVYGAKRLTNCWYVTFDPSLTGTTLGPSYLVAVSKKDGKILFSGLTGGD